MTYQFRYQVYRRTLRIPLRTAHGLWTEREGILVRLEGEAGRVGFGEIAPVPGFGTETLAEAEAVCRGLGDRVDEKSLAAVPAQFGCVRFALAAAQAEIACGEGATSAVQLPRVPVTALLPAGRAALALLPARLEEGFLSFKWKVGVGDAADEMALLDDVLARLPAYAKLRVDANGAWNRRQAGKWLARCAERPVEFVEQPVAPADKSALLGLAEDFPVKLALDESVTRLDEARRWQAEGWPGIFVLKPALAGPLEDMAAWVEASGADVVLSSALESALGRAAILRFALRRPALTKRALGFGLGEVFGERQWDGPVVGPTLDAGWSAGVDAEALWNALN